MSEITDKELRRLLEECRDPSVLSDYADRMSPPIVAAFTMIAAGIAEDGERFREQTRGFLLRQRGDQTLDALQVTEAAIQGVMLLAAVLQLAHSKVTR